MPHRPLSVRPRLFIQYAAHVSSRRFGSGARSGRARPPLVDFDKAGERLDAEVCERHHARVARAVDPDQAVLLVHFGGHVAQPVLILSEHFRDPGDGVDVVNLVDRGQDQIRTNINAAQSRLQQPPLDLQRVRHDAHGGVARVPSRLNRLERR